MRESSDVTTGGPEVPHSGTLTYGRLTLGTEGTAIGKAEADRAAIIFSHIRVLAIFLPDTDLARVLIRMLMCGQVMPVAQDAK